jgi:hypothetical protein
MDADGYLVRTSWAGREGETVVHDACHTQDLPRLQALLAAGHDPWPVTDTGATPLTVLTRYWRSSAVMYRGDDGTLRPPDGTSELQDRILQCVDAIFVQPDTARLRVLGPDRRDLVLRSCGHLLGSDDALGGRVTMYLTALGLADQARERASF